ncbi:MAG: 16S rRNA (cytidine(1402)-2'-O)-methyltransferase [Endomicrobium sp.]|jgi:16S rRNA (cytidine1402-2'-O)-methyltransferase|nr:16S rRNA (cytidine(1402)-2'-O)-methyltransferase [Endomicrobium sp.]
MLKESKKSGVLYIVPTPIGNLEDITLRALRVLKECDAVACEDTKKSLKLLSHFGISKPLVSFHSYSKRYKVEYVINKLLNGNKIALVSNAGTPCISDPGHILVKVAIEKYVKIEVLPGANALITALIGSGLPTDGFVFCGFLRRKSGKIKKELSELLSLKKTIIFYESPHRIIKTMCICKDVFGKNAEICLAREITKKFEEFIRGSIVEILRNIESRRDLLGEFVVLIYPKIKL